MKIFFQVVLTLFILCIVVRPAFAIYNPAERPNNKFGIHILFPSELASAAKLVNTTGGDWGYVTIPIQYGDRDLEKWQTFMDDCRRFHLIPIVRLSTEPYFANTSVWRKPTNFDILDFANFLDSLAWPTKNRYVLLFNEANRYDEWGGEPPAPEQYADFVVYAVDIFKSMNKDFFMIAGGLDNASPNDRIKYMDNFAYLKRMGDHNPEAFTKIDGFASHSYPNPNFAQAPSKTKIEGTSTYIYEMNVIEEYAGASKPVFITETGWNSEVLPKETVASYLKAAMTDWSQDKNIIAVTPFILEAGGGPFNKFTFLKGESWTLAGEAYRNMNKIKGVPEIASVSTASKFDQKPTPTRKLPIQKSTSVISDLTSRVMKAYFKAVFAIGK